MIFIIGNFGYKNNHIDGQTFKTRTVKEELKKRFGEKQIIYNDTSFIKANPVKFFLGLKRNYIKSDIIIFLLGRKGLQVVLPLLTRWNKNRNKQIIYIVIGGWLPKLLEKRPRLMNHLKKIDGVYVETKSMTETLIRMGVQKSYLLPNFRNFNYQNYSLLKTKKPLKLVYFSRIVKEKGIEDIINCVTRINTNNNELLLTLDLYGPIKKQYQKKFYTIMNETERYICYKGFLEPSQIYTTLAKYDLMAFPTFYKGEGFPGAIIDAFISGVPVLASDWKYNKEIIQENKTGKLFKTRDLDDLEKKLTWFLQNIIIIDKMKVYAKEEARKYHTDQVLSKFFDSLII